MSDVGVVYKYPFPEGVSSLNVYLPVGSRVLTAQIQREVVCLWILRPVWASAEECRSFAFFGTGDPNVPAACEYIATVQDGGLVWHVFELK